MRIQIVAISYMFVHPKRPFDNYLSLSVPRPSAISPAPKVVLIINIYYLLLMQGGEEQRKKFVVPNKQELIEEIKALSDQIEHVSLNLIKCDFQAVEKDVEKAFPDFQLIKVKKYNPGSFEVIFQSKIDAINFIRSSFDKKILTRRFFIKMGRQQKEHAQNWTAVGYVPKQFKQGPKKNTKFERDPKKQETAKEGEEQGKPEGTVEHKPAEHKVQHKVEEHKPQHKVEKKVEHKVEHKQEPKVQHKVENKVQHKPAQHKPAQHKQVQHKPAEHVKPAQHKVIPKYQHKPKTADKPAGDKKPAVKPEPAHKTEHAHKVQPVHKVEHKVENKQLKVQPKKDQKVTDTKQHKVEEKKENKVEQKKAEDDEWIFVPSKKGKPKK